MLGECQKNKKEKKIELQVTEGVAWGFEFSQPVHSKQKVLIGPPLETCKKSVNGKYLMLFWCTPFVVCSMCLEHASVLLPAIQKQQLLAVYLNYD